MAGGGGVYFKHDSNINKIFNAFRIFKSQTERAIFYSNVRQKKKKIVLFRNINAPEKPKTANRLSQQKKKKEKLKEINNFN